MLLFDHVQININVFKLNFIPNIVSVNCCLYLQFLTFKMYMLTVYTVKQLKPDPH